MRSNPVVPDVIDVDVLCEEAFAMSKVDKLNEEKAFFDPVLFDSAQISLDNAICENGTKRISKNLDLRDPWFRELLI